MTATVPAPAASLPTMVLATYKDLCIDVSDAERMEPFWAGALGLRADTLADGDSVLVGPTPQHRVWINAVPEERTVKQRVHVDVIAASVEALEELGAVRRSADGEFPWMVLVDPEGGELCVFVREEVPDYRLYELVVDAVDPAPIARWWGEVLGGRVVDSERGFSYVDQIPGVPFDSFDFIPVPEPKTVKNRIHWDVVADELQPLLDAGARLVRERDDEIEWTVLADPEGNEFCVFTG